jgi:hypothetical protein
MRVTIGFPLGLFTRLPVGSVNSVQTVKAYHSTTTAVTVPDVEDWVPIHSQACHAGQGGYTDPTTGFFVFSAHSHQQRGKCCGRGCRHCPFHHANVPTNKRATQIQQPAWLHHPPTPLTTTEGAERAGNADTGTTSGSRVKVVFYSVRGAFSDGNLHSRMPLDPTHVRFISGVYSSYRLAL